MCLLNPSLEQPRTAKFTCGANLQWVDLCGENMHWKCVITGVLFQLRRLGFYFNEGEDFHQRIALCTEKQGWIFFFFFEGTLC